MQFRKYTKEQLIEAIKTSKSIAETLQKLNVAPHGGNYNTVNTYIKQLNLDTSHFKGQGWNKGKSFGHKRCIEDYFSNKHKINSNNLRKRLFKDGYFEQRCYKCTLSEWNGQPIPLELEHIDGNHSNNNLSNLTILCPNCHAQTPTYRRGKQSFIPKDPKNNFTKQCECGKMIHKNSIQCQKCFIFSRRKVIRPSYEQLKQELSESNYCAVARKYGVTDNTIRKWLKSTAEEISTLTP